jgi:hypothetical protein
MGCHDRMGGLVLIGRLRGRLGPWARTGSASLAWGRVYVCFRVATGRKAGRSHNSSVAMAGRPGVRFPTEARDFALLYSVQTGSEVHPGGLKLTTQTI